MKTKMVEENSDLVDLKEITEVWRVVFYGITTQETVLILADGAEMALEKALNYQTNYGMIKDWPLTSLERISTTVI
jgi:hypothetical protein